GTVCHPKRLQHRIAHEFREGLFGDIHNHLLHYRVAAAGISPLAAWDIGHTNGGIVGRPRAIKDLRSCWGRLVPALTEESVNCEARGVAENATQGDLLLFRKLVLRDLPRAQISVNVRVQGETAFLNEMQGAHRSHGFTDGTSLEERVGRHRRLAALV